VADRKIRRTWTLNGWLEWLEPDWEEWREHLASAPPLDPDEQLAAARRYVMARYNAGSWAAWLRATRRPDPPGDG
jgi:hypothetical protein